MRFGKISGWRRNIKPETMDTIVLVVCGTLAMIAVGAWCYVTLLITLSPMEPTTPRYNKPPELHSVKPQRKWRRYPAKKQRVVKDKVATESH